MGEDLELIEAELDEANDTIDDMTDTIGKLIIDIAHKYTNFICTQCRCTKCLSTAAELYRLMKKYTKENDTYETAQKFENITGKDIEEL